MLAEKLDRLGKASGRQQRSARLLTANISGMEGKSLDRRVPLAPPVFFGYLEQWFDESMD